MRTFLRTTVLMLAVVGLALLAGCQKAQRGPAPLPDLKVGVAGFTQPLTMADLLAGYIPDDQHKADATHLADLDRAFAEELKARTTRAFSYVRPSVSGVDASKSHSASRPLALTYWVELGKKAGVDLLVVPHVVDYVEREGGDMGVTKAAKVMIDTYLIDIRDGSLVSRSHFDEQQVGLAENILDMQRFLSRGGKWLSATDLSREGMRKAIKEFGL